MTVHLTPRAVATLVAALHAWQNELSYHTVEELRDYHPELSGHEPARTTTNLGEGGVRLHPHESAVGQHARDVGKCAVVGDREVMPVRRGIPCDALHQWHRCPNDLGVDDVERRGEHLTALPVYQKAGGHVVHASVP